MKKYRKTGGGLLGAIDKVKKPLGGILAVIAILTLFGFAGQDDLNEAKVACMPQVQLEELEEIAETVPETEYTHEMDILIEKFCKEYEVDDVMAIAIARLETGHYTSDVFTECNNFGGMMSGNRFHEYATPEDGAEAFVKMLAKFAGKGKDTPEKMAETYCPVNPSWAKIVRQIMKEVEL